MLQITGVIVMEDQTNKIQAVRPSEYVEIHLRNEVVLRGLRGTALCDFLKILGPEESEEIVGAVVNGRLRELTFPIWMESQVNPVTIGTTDGSRIYRRSLTFLLEAAFSEIFEEGILAVDHSVFAGGYYCQVLEREPLDQDDLDRLEAHMRVLVENDLKFERFEVQLDVAIEYFQSKGMDDKVRLLAHRKKNYLMLYRFGDHQDYHHGYMVPSSGYIRWFKLQLTHDGFFLRFPRRHKPREILPLEEKSKLLATFRLYGDWLDLLGIANVGALNDAIKEKRVWSVVLVSEALHEQRVAEIASHIVMQREKIRIVLVAGPSSSGKTTFAKRLAIQLLAHGISPFPLELDNFFVDRERTPRDEAGLFNYEHLDAIDRVKLGDCLSRLISGEKVQLPQYNFHRGVGEPGEIVQLQPDQIVILEGIHGLNPSLLPDIPEEKTYRIYLSALTQLNLDRHNRVSTTDTRLVRRIVRDTRERGYSPQDTIKRWESVRRGEKRYIFPYQENADVMFNSALVYELSALKPFAEPLLRQVPYGTPEHIEAKRLLALLEWFLPLDPDLIPDNSIQREFIGGSILKDFMLWRNQRIR
jgi:uridine kinase